jgi:hypothetical protein
VRSVVIMGEAQPALRQAPVTTAVPARRLRLASPVTAMVLGTLVLAEMVATLVLAGLDHQLGWSAAVTGPGLLIFTGVAVLVAYHQPRNPVGWILLLFCSLWTLSVAAARLNDAVDLDSIRDDLAHVVQNALEPAHVSVWVSKHD